MDLTNVCIITNDVRGLRDFYRATLQVDPKDYTEHYVESPMEHGTLSLYSLTEYEELAPGSAQAATNRSIMREFEVDDVDAQFERLKMDVEWVMFPTTLSWGNRSAYFRDPDGNLINFFSRVPTHLGAPPELEGKILPRIHITAVACLMTFPGYSVFGREIHTSRYIRAPSCFAKVNPRPIAEVKTPLNATFVQSCVPHHTCCSQGDHKWNPKMSITQ